jgi:hypothetical protein
MWGRENARSVDWEKQGVMVMVKVMVMFMATAADDGTSKTPLTEPSRAEQSR